MKKGQIIKKILGEVLEPLGFIYNNPSGVNVWEFKRNVKNKEDEDIEQLVFVQKSRFSNQLFLEIRTNAYGQMPKRISSFVPGSKYSAVSYESDEDFIRVIKIFADVVKEHGLKNLEKMIEPTSNDRPREDDYLKLLNNHVQIAEDFIKKEGIPEDISLRDAIDLVYKALCDNKDKSYGEVKDLLMDLGAFYTYQLEKHYESRWEYREEKKKAILIFTNGKHQHICLALDFMTNCWRDIDGKGINKLQLLREEAFINANC